MTEKPQRKYGRNDMFRYGKQVAVVQYAFSTGYNCRIGCCQLKSFTEEELDQLEKISVDKIKEVTAQSEPCQRISKETGS